MAKLSLPIWRKWLRRGKARFEIGHMGNRVERIHVRIWAYDPEPRVQVDFNQTAQSCIFAPIRRGWRAGAWCACLAWKIAGGDVADRMYLVVAGVIAAAIVADVSVNDSAASLFLVRKLFHLVEYLEFWR